MRDRSKTYLYFKEISLKEEVLPMGAWNQTVKGLLNLFLKSNCPLCQRPTSQEFCEDCQRQLQRCQMSNPNQFWQGQLPVFAWGGYGGAMKRAIAALKYENHPQLARPLGHWLAQAWLNSPVSAQIKLTVVPIPMHRSKVSQRGYNQADLLAQSFCDYTGYPMRSHGLERVRATEAQFSLSGTEREKNLAGAFSLGKEFLRSRPSTPVLLLDDIYTTGATAQSAAQTLAQHGLHVYGLVAVATPKRVKDDG